MEVGDLVHLSPIYFYEFDECLGIIVETSTDGEYGQMIVMVLKPAGFMKKNWRW